MTTLEEASRCPKCQQPCTVVGSRPAVGATQRGAVLRSYACVNQRCKWFNQVARIVQINPDGSIPEPPEKRDKQFPKVPDRSDAVNRQLEEQLARETEEDPSRKELRGR